MYQRLDNCDTEQELQEFHAELADRFGPVPKQVEDLFTTVRCRRLAVELGFEKMLLKDAVLKCFFINRPDSPYFESDIFRELLSFIQTGTNKAKLKQAGKLFLLVVTPIPSMEEMHRFLSQVHKAVIKHPAISNVME